jgi:hypothetical protein
LSQLYIPQPTVCPQNVSRASLESLERKEILQRGHSLSIPRAYSADPSPSSLASTGESTPASSAPADSSSPDSYVAPPDSPIDDNGQAPQVSRQTMFWCTQCPNRAPFPLQSQLKSVYRQPHNLLDVQTNCASRHAKTHSKPYACRMHPHCGIRFAEQRDRRRHEARQGVQAQSAVQYFCPHDCERSPLGADGGFGIREDNAKRHIRNRHGGSTMAPIRIIT